LIFIIQLLMPKKILANIDPRRERRRERQRELLRARPQHDSREGELVIC
jgi:hypothetical protein